MNRSAILAWLLVAYFVIAWWGLHGEWNRARAELALCRDSLATERADLIACYQSKPWAAPDTVWADTAYFRSLAR